MPEGIAAHLPNEGMRRFAAAGVGHSGRADNSERIEEILRREWDQQPGME